MIASASEASSLRGRARACMHVNEEQIEKGAVAAACSISCFSQQSDRFIS
jgi:AMMECR1 domain-containing protein